MPPKKKGLGPAFSCRLREDQDRVIRADAAFHGITKVEALRRRLDKAQAAIDDEAAELSGLATLMGNAEAGDGDAD